MDVSALPETMADDRQGGDYGREHGAPEWIIDLPPHRYFP
jgi:hypothetical protein